jgi:hypothetical protein
VTLISTITKSPCLHKSHNNATLSKVQPKLKDSMWTIFPLQNCHQHLELFHQVKINRTRLAFTRRPTAVRSTTPATVSSTDAPIRTRPAQTESQTTRGVFRRRRPIGGSSSTQAPLAPSTLAQEVNSLPGKCCGGFALNA